MITYYSADYILPVSSPAIKNGIIGIDEDGIVQGLYGHTNTELRNKEVIRLEGILIPGLINAHCHLELSHLVGKIPRETGLPDFLTAVMSERKGNEKSIVSAMKKADKTMFENGIQAVGDHVNTAISANIKAESPIQYHSFVEILGLDDNDIQQKLDQSRDVEYYFNNKASITPHASYSCSKNLIKTISKSIDSENILSIHNQESDEENKLFRYGNGAFLDFYKKNNIPYNHFKPTGKDSLQSYIPLLPKKNKLILIHNTYTGIKDISFLERVERDVFFCLCPKANLYIEGQLPHINTFVLNRQTIVIGTDSLASNDSLNIIEELQVIQQNQPDLPLETIIKWATLNGAQALGLDAKLGSLEIGKKPGLVLLEHMNTLRFTSETKVRRIV